jgi:hypothetical protein
MQENCMTNVKRCERQTQVLAVIALFSGALLVQIHGNGQIPKVHPGRPLP